jgi:hypothetical protein
MFFRKTHRAVGAFAQGHFTEIAAGLRDADADGNCQLVADAVECEATDGVTKFVQGLKCTLPVSKNDNVFVSAIAVCEPAGECECLQTAHEYRKYLLIDDVVTVLRIQALEVVNIEECHGYRIATHARGLPIVSQIRQNKSWCLQEMKLFIVLALGEVNVTRFKYSLDFVQSQKLRQPRQPQRNCVSEPILVRKIVKICQLRAKDRYGFWVRGLCSPRVNVGRDKTAVAPATRF